MDRRSYEKDLKKRQKAHLKNVRRFEDQSNWQICLHDQCQDCIGTGVKHDGSPCVHFMCCSCSKCSPSYLINPGITFTSGTDVNMSVTSNPNLIIDGTIGSITYTSTNTWTVETVDA